MKRSNKYNKVLIGNVIRFFGGVIIDKSHKVIFEVKTHCYFSKN